MRQLTMTEERSIEWWEVPEPRIEHAGDAIVRPVVVALCDLDAPVIAGEVPLPGPIALGHECVAEVLEVGEDVNGTAPGDLVVVPFEISCGACEFCARGLTASCAAVPARASYGFGAFGGDWGGALSDLLRVPFAGHMLTRIPEGLAPSLAASISDNVPDAWRVVAPHLRARPGADVLIMGGGARSIPLYAVDLACALGAGTVTYVDTDAERLEIARDLGAETIEGPAEYSYDPRPITVDASASHEGLAAALRSTEPGGVCTSVGGYYNEMLTPVPMFEMFAIGLTFITGRAHVRAHIPQVLELAGSGAIRPGLVTTRTVAWDDAAEAVAEQETKLVIERAPTGP